MAEAMGRNLTPGPFIPTVIASTVLAFAAGGSEEASRLVPSLVDGTLVGAVALNADVTFDGATASGDAGVVLGGGLAAVRGAALVARQGGRPFKRCATPPPRPAQPRRCAQGDDVHRHRGGRGR